MVFKCGLRIYQGVQDETKGSWNFYLLIIAPNWFWELRGTICERLLEVGKRVGGAVREKNMSPDPLEQSRPLSLQAEQPL